MTTKTTTPRYSPEQLLVEAEGFADEHGVAEPLLTANRRMVAMLRQAARDAETLEKLEKMVPRIREVRQLLSGAR